MSTVYNVELRGLGLFASRRAGGSDGGCFRSASHHLSDIRSGPPSMSLGAFQPPRPIGNESFLPKRTKSSATVKAALPSREDLVAFVANAPGKVGKREIARA